MEAVFINENSRDGVHLIKAVNVYFERNTLESTKFRLWQLFQCWAVKDCKIKAETSDEEIALFFDQLIELVAAASTLHESYRANQDEKENKL